MTERFIQDPEWYEQANCATTDPEVMFPTEKGGMALAKAVCARCIVIEDCLTDALRAPVQRGVAGGLNASERKRLIKEGEV